VTPAEFLSLATVAVKVTESAPSTVVAEAFTETPIGAELPPQPDTLSKTPIIAKLARSETKLHVFR
jgi:hypothetical protein